MNRFAIIVIGREKTLKALFLCNHMNCRLDLIDHFLAIQGI